MAFASSLRKGQIPIGCQLCEGGTKIQWKCCDCDFLIYTRCKDKIHSIFKDGQNHRIIDIKEVVQQTSGQTFAFSNFNCQQHSHQTYCLFCVTCCELICLKCKTKTHKGHNLLKEDEYFANIRKVNIVDPPEQETKIEFKVVKQFTSELRNIHHTEVCSDGSLWISDLLSRQLQHIQIKGNNIQVLLRLNTYVWDMAVKQSDELLICDIESTLKQVSRTGEVTDSPYSVAPMISTAVHVTSSNTVIIGAMTKGAPFPAAGRRVVMMMDQKGSRLVEYELDSNKEPLFTFPTSITSTNEGKICVVDQLDSDNVGRVVVLSPTGDAISTYSGHSDINMKEPFKPMDINTTALNNIVVVDINTHTIHILDSEGHFITCYKTIESVILFPHSVAVSYKGNSFIGCSSTTESPNTVKAKLYEVEFSRTTTVMEEEGLACHKTEFNPPFLLNSMIQVRTIIVVNYYIFVCWFSRLPVSWAFICGLFFFIVSLLFGILLVTFI